MKRSSIIVATARRFRFVSRALLTLSLKGYLPISIYDHWIARSIEKDLWPAVSWIGRDVCLDNGMIIEVDPRDYVGREIMDHGCFEPETVQYIQTFLKPGMVFCDVGANIGQYSLIASKLVGSVGRVHSFEPYPLIYKVLQRNLKRNHCANVECNHVALDEQDGLQLLYLSDCKGFGSTSLAPAEHYSGVHVTVPTTSLDKYVEARSVKRVDLMKIDVEGAELRVLKGATCLLDTNRDIVLIIELNDTAARRFQHSAAELVLYLQNIGFRLFRFEKAGLEPYKPRDPEPLCFTNVVATRQKP